MDETYTKKSVFDDPVRINPSSNSLKIEPISLEQRPLLTHIEYYLELSRTVTKLEIVAVPENDLELLLGVFSSVSSLTLQNIRIISMQVDYLPRGLQQLALVDCKMVHQVSHLEADEILNDKS